MILPRWDDWRSDLLHLISAAAGSLCPHSLPPGEPHALYIHTGVLIHTTYRDLSARFTWREERQQWKFPSSGSWWAGSGEALECRRRKGQKRASCPLQRRTGGRWIEMDRRTACGPLVGGIHCTAAAFWDTASAVPLLDIQLSPLALDGIQKNLLDRQTEAAGTFDNSFQSLKL